MGEHPFYRFYRRVTLPLTMRQYHRMPRHPSFKHEYWDGALHWTPRPHTCNAYLDLAAWQPPPLEAGRPREVRIRRLAESDWPQMPLIFRSAFSAWPPLGQWEGPASLRAARCILEWTRRGRDGPLLAEASVVAHLDGRREDDAETLAGAALVTLTPARQLRGAPVAAEAETLLPHLTWIFVSNWEQRGGVGTSLLAAVVAELRALGHDMLASTVLTANEAAMLWHWRHGFQLGTGSW